MQPTQRPKLLWGSGNLLIINPTRKQEDYLSYWHKTLEFDPRTRQRKPRREKVQLFTVIQESPIRIIQTFQGFVDKLLELEQCDFVDKRIKMDKPDLSRMSGFRGSQEALFRELVSKERSGLLKAPTRYGKCFAAGTYILMLDGTQKKVEDVVIGDSLMGPDSKPRTVISLAQGSEQMVEIVPNRGEPFGCNLSHILALVRTNDGRKLANQTTEMTVAEYLASSPSFKHVHKLYRAGVDFQEKTLLHDPWVMGIWLADGTFTAPEITKPDREVQDYLRSWAATVNLVMKVDEDGMHMNFRKAAWLNYKTDKNELTEIRRLCVATGEKRIPHEYLTASRTDRLQLLAGLVDGDGYLSGGKCYEIVTKYSGLRDDILFLSRSLGFGATCCIKRATIKSTGFVGYYHRIGINGDITKLPVKVIRKKGHPRHNKFNPLRTGFKVVPKGVGNYFGFTLAEPDGLFLLGDFTVVHNSMFMANMMRVLPNVPTVLTAPGVDLLGQTVRELRERLPGREVKGIFSGSKDKAPSSDITVCGIDSLHKMDTLGTRLLLVDEPHAAVSESRAPMLAMFKNARIYGFGATLSGRYDGADKLITGIIGPVLAEKTYTQAVQEGAICPIKVWMVRLAFEPYRCTSRDQAYSQLLYKNLGFNDLVKQISDFIIPADFQTIVFADEVKQIDLMNTFVTSGIPACAKKMTTKGRNELFGKMVRNEIKRCIATDIFSTGVTFPDIRVIINAASGGSGIVSTQKVGRMAQCRPGKTFGHMIDFLWEPEGLTTEQLESREFDRNSNQWSNVCRDSRERLRVYQEVGYTIQHVSDINEIKIS